MENSREKIEAALAALLDDNQIVFDELVDELMRDKIEVAIDAKREEFKKTAFASTPEEQDELADDGETPGNTAEEPTVNEPTE